MSSFAVFVVIVVLIAAALGFKSGLMKQVGKVAGVVLGIVACRMFGSILAGMFISEDASSTDKVLYTVLAYVLLFLIIYIVATFVAHFMKSALRTIHLGMLDRLAGAVFTVAEWLVLLSMVLNLWESVFPTAQLADDSLYARILLLGPYLLGACR